MSHTYSLCIYAPLQADLFEINLNKPLKSVWSFDDWDDLTLHLSDEDLTTIDRLTPETALGYFRNLRSAGRQTRGWHFAVNAKTRYLSACLPVWTNNAPRLILGLNILRQVLPTSGDGDSGYILAHRFDGADSKSLAAILLRHGKSKVAGPHTQVIRQIVDHASPLASRVQAKSKLPQPHIVDELDALSGAHSLA